MGKPNGSGDLLGLRPYGEAIKIVAKGTVEGAGAFLGRICLPAAEEFGLLLRDKVSHWRANNAARITEQAELLLEGQGGVNGKHAHPRIVGKILEHGSWEDDSAVQKMWAGLLASACTDDGKDQRNLVFVNLLEQMTAAQSKLLKYACENSAKYKTKEGLIGAQTLPVLIHEAMRLLEAAEIDDADVQLDHMRQIGVLGFGSGFQPDSDIANLAPSALGLHLYARCSGFSGSPIKFFEVTETQPPNPTSEESLTAASTL